VACPFHPCAARLNRSSRQNISTEGIDIVLEIDLSGSMVAEDFNPNRIEAAKQCFRFHRRPFERPIGLVVFPRRVLRNALERRLSRAEKSSEGSKKWND